MSNKKILTSGCGVSWGGQNKKTWVNILKTLGANIEDVGGPAVSNQWILDQSINHLIRNTDISHVVIQLTDLDKLDVEITPERMAELVVPDSLRNFVVQGVWPSSNSQEHQSKQLWAKWLASPGLELHSMCGKLVLLSHWCHSHNIDLTVFQGYDLPWTLDQQSQLCKIIDFDVVSAVPEYQLSDSYRWHDHNNQNTVPCLEFQFELALRISLQIDSMLHSRVLAAQHQYFKRHHAG